MYQREKTTRINTDYYIGFCLHVCVWVKTTQGFYCSKMPQVASVLNSASPPSSVDASHGETPQGLSLYGVGILTFNYHRHGPVM